MKVYGKSHYSLLVIWRPSEIPSQTGQRTSMSPPNNYIPISNIWGQGLVRRRHVYSSKTNILAHPHFLTLPQKSHGTFWSRTSMSPGGVLVQRNSLASTRSCSLGPTPLSPPPCQRTHVCAQQAGRRGGEIAHMKTRTGTTNACPPPAPPPPTYTRHPAEFFWRLGISLFH